MVAKCAPVPSDQAEERVSIDALKGAEKKFGKVCHNLEQNQYSKMEAE